MTDADLKELENYTKSYELVQPTARLTKLLRLAVDEINGLRNEVDRLTPKEEKPLVVPKPIGYVPPRNRPQGNVCPML